MQMNNRGSSLVKLLPAVWMIASILCGTSGNSDFFLVGSDLKTCKGVAELNKAHCKNSEGLELHCVLDKDYQLGIGHLPKIWVPKGNCPFYRNDFGVIDYRPCVADASACPNDTDWYLSTDAYKYPVCIQESKTARGSTQTTSITTENTGIREKKRKDSTGEPQPDISCISKVEAVQLPFTGYMSLHSSVSSVQSETGVKLPVPIMDGGGVKLPVPIMDGGLKAEYAVYSRGSTESRDERNEKSRSYPP